MAHWWQTGIVYQIYPRSFQDSNGDGVGDLAGILQRLDYLEWLGIDAIWISPIYPSPMADFGYDVSDYLDVHPLFGTLEDMDRVIEASHARDMKVILDFVPNHTSNEHPWFIESRSSRDNPKRDWYFWHDPAPDGGPPNNWLSRFDGKSAWQWDPLTEQYYLHSFLAEQPDLNWRNPELRRQMLDVLRFWYRRGVDGFRIDVSYRVMKDRALRDNPVNKDWVAGVDPAHRLIERYSKNTPDVHQFNRWLREVNDEFEDRVLIGEINLPINRLVQHYGDGDELHLPFNFWGFKVPWQAEAFADLIRRYEAALPAGAWPNWVLGNHDVHRVASRVGQSQAPLAMMLLLTLRGTPTVYYGDEIGMHDVAVAPDQVQDPWEKFVPGLGLGRDPERTPMQWSAEPNAGFCPPDVEPWLPIAEDYEAVNVERQRQEEDSMLRFTQQLISLRRRHAALNRGDIELLDNMPNELLAYVRELDGRRFLVVLNFGEQQRLLELPFAAERVLSTHATDDSSRGDSGLLLQPNEGVLLQAVQGH